MSANQDPECAQDSTNPEWLRRYADSRVRDQLDRVSDEIAWLPQAVQECARWQGILDVANPREDLDVCVVIEASFQLRQILQRVQKINEMVRHPYRIHSPEGRHCRTAAWLLGVSEGVATAALQPAESNVNQLEAFIEAAARLRDLLAPGAPLTDKTRGVLWHMTRPRPEHAAPPSPGEAPTAPGPAPAPQPPASATTQPPAPTVKLEAEDTDVGGPTKDPYDDRYARYFGKRIYLGYDTEVSRLFWLLAKPVGAAATLARVQQAIDGMETTRDMLPDDVRKAAQRLRKVVSKLRAAMLQAGLDAHLLIVKGGSQDEPEYSMIRRFA